ncbi:MAG: OmpA family protein [Kiritimatiellae bacterium]|nr:OmpA family protein [Kiritimatiellia bacterium]
MKCTKTTVAAMAAVLALALAGCKYADDDLANGAKGAKGGSDVVQGANVDSDLGGVVNDDGTPATEVPFDRDANYVRCTDVEFAPVYFGFDASNLAASESAKIEAVAKHLNENADRVVIVEGNCDERGSNEYNISLGNLRAISIRDYLVTLGVADARVQTKSYGEEKPAVAGSGEEAWALNRRGEFAIFRHK